MFYFGGFSFDPATGELTRDNGDIERLTPQVAQVLRLMVEQPGEVIGREEFRRQLWPDTTVEFDQGLSFCVRQLRIAVGDDASNPKYIETLPRRGYRFRFPVSRERSAPASDSKTRRVHRAWLPAAIAAVLIVVGGLVAWRSHRVSASTPLLAIVPFDIDSSVTGLRSYRDALADVIVERATTRAARTVVIIGPALTRQFGSRTPIDTIRARIGARFALSGVVRRAPNGFELFAQLVRSSDRGHVWAFRVVDSASGGDYGRVGERIADSVARILLDERGERVPLGIERVR
ncbi:MAG TPA: winged helix-turn-helix domain-containing protein [Gemmatimonadaceae bacterium]|jgi:DNA-binding winged helix-turn-helix (wHTH) protein/TolB-like protein